MAKIRNASPKQSGGGYDRLVGDHSMAEIFTKAQSTVITNGTELEKIISRLSTCIGDLDSFLDMCDKRQMEDGTYLCTKKVVKESKYKLAGHEPDFVVFIVNESMNLCYVVELKDGDSFDTKKSVAEKEMLQLFVNHIAPKIPFRTKYYICCFNQQDKDKIVSGFKKVFLRNEVLTGEEFCQMLGIDYKYILGLRASDIEDNFNYVSDSMLKIKGVRERFISNQRKHISEREFYD